MATGGPVFYNLNEEVEYYDKLYKTILNSFVSCIPAVQFKDCTSISRKLTDQEMQMVQKRHENEGANAAARLLLSFLKTKKNWFDAFMQALDTLELKLQDLKPEFLKLKADVDREWIKTHPPGPNMTVGNPSVASVLNPPTQSTTHGQQRVAMETDRTARAPVPVFSGSCMPNDFALPPPITGLQKDAALEKEEDMVSAPTSERPRRAVSLSGQRGEGEQAPSQGEGGRGEEEQYTDARSVSTEDDYEQLRRRFEDLDTEYTDLTNVCLEKDASPIPVQVSEVPEQEVGEEAQPRVLTPQQAQQRRQRPRTREEHPSLRVAISSDPQKDFEEDFVTRELRELRGWSSRQEEHRVVHLVRPHRSTAGYFVIWYWALAKRPTICVAQGGRVITFVVHKSTSTPTKFYINRRQKRCESLRELVKYHLDNGIQYSPREGETITLWLSHPYTRE